MGLNSLSIVSTSKHKASLSNRNMALECRRWFQLSPLPFQIHVYAPNSKESMSDTKVAYSTTGMLPVRTVYHHYYHSSLPLLPALPTVPALFTEDNNGAGNPPNVSAPPAPYSMY